MRQRKQRLYKYMVSASFRMLLVVFIMVFSVMYVWQTNAVSTKGYTISDLEQTVTELERENRRLQVEIAKNTSMQHLQDRIKDTNLVAVGHIDYISSVGTAVAQR